MVSEKYIRGMLYEEFAARVLQAAGPKILNEQADRVEAYYNVRTGHIAAALRQHSYTVRKMAGGAVLQFDYLIDLRFLDAKTTKNGKKKIYGPVYNKPLWGFVYGYVFGTLRYGLDKDVKKEIFGMIRENYKKPLEQ